MKHWVLSLCLLIGFWNWQTQLPDSPRGRRLWWLLAIGFSIQIMGTALSQGWSWNTDTLVIWSLMIVGGWMVYSQAQRVGQAAQQYAIVQVAATVLFLTAVSSIFNWRVAIPERAWQGFPLGNPNVNAYAWAVLLAVILPHVFKKRREEQSPHSFWFLVSASLAGLIALYLCQSRGAWLGLALGSLPALIYLFSRRRKSVGMGAGIGLLGLVALMFLVYKGFITSETMEIRQQLWTKSIAMGRDHPLIGVGPGRWMAELPVYGLEDTQGTTGELIFRRPHNEWLRAFAESGLIGLLWLLSLWIYGWWCWARKNWLNVRTQLSWGAVGLVLSTAMCFEFPLERIPLFAGMMGWLLICTSEEASKVQSGLSRSRWPARALFIILFLLSTLRWMGWRQVEKVERARATGQWEALTAATGRAQQLGMRHNEFGIPLIWMKGQALRAKGEPAAARLAFEAALEHNPNQIRIMNDLASSWIVDKKLLEAKELLERASQTSQSYLPVRINLAICYYNLGDRAEARALLMEVDSAQCAQVEWRTIKQILE